MKILLAIAIFLSVMLIQQPSLFAEEGSSHNRFELCGIPYERLGCGCRFRIEKKTCQTLNSSDQHLFIEPLSEGEDVLWLNNGGVEIKLQSTVTNKIMSNPDSRHIGRYQNDELSVEIDSQPSQIRCPSCKEGDDCEYVDVKATIVITPRWGTPVQYNAIGSCGC